jgi:hypothetical protein
LDLTGGLIDEGDDPKETAMGQLRETNYRAGSLSTRSRFSQ